MKKITALILAAALLTSAGAAAQTVKIQTDSTTVTTTVTDGASVDSATVAVTQSADFPTLDEDEPRETPTVGITDGKWTVDYDGTSYGLTELVETASDNDTAYKMGKEEVGRLKNQSIPAILAIIFGIPCLTIIIGLIVILVYSLKRTKGRNELINNAIEHDYQLPDSFYEGQKNSSRPDAPMRDSRRFYRAISLLSVGLALIIFAISEDIPFFYVAGGIPFLIGVGQMIGYFCVPSTDYYRGPVNRPPYPPRQEPAYGPMPPYNVPPMNQPPMPQQPQGTPAQNMPNPAWNQPAQPVTPPPYNPANAPANPCDTK